MEKRIIALVGAFIILTNLIGQTTLTVYATSLTEESTEDGTTHGGGGYTRPSDPTDITGFENWDTADRVAFWIDNIFSVLPAVAGVVVNPLHWDYSYISDQIQQHAQDVGYITSSDDYFDWVSKCLSTDDNGELVVNDELADAMYQTINIMIQEECGWYEMKTLDYRDVSATSFTTQGLYNAFVSYCTQNLKGTDNVIFAKTETRITSDGVTVFYIPTTETLSGVEYYQNVVSGNECLAYITKEWTTVNVSFKRLTESGFTDTQHSTSNTTFLNATGIYSLDGRGIPITDGSRTVRVYKSLEELKNYSVGQRPYYVTDKFLNYDISGDNSCILSESDLSNGSVYGDVYNYIMDNYDNPNNLTEDQLTIIVENYINGSGGGSVSGNGTGSSGNGLSDFLGGLGSVGDAILSILGKLLEYVGKALDLVSGTVTKVLDIVPKNITALLSALFPFFPEEWLLAIELGLVLSVIVGIVGIFKK